MKKLSIFPFTISPAIVCFLFLTVSSGAQGSIRVYVSAGTGSDLTGNGSMANPWATIGKAIDSVHGRAVNSYEIIVAAGIYNENELDMGEYESVFGGYDPYSWERDIKGQPTIVDGGGYDNNIFWGEDHCTIDGLTLQNANRGIFCYGSSPIISNCRFTDCYHGVSSAEGAVIQKNIFEGNGKGIFCGDNAGFVSVIENNLILSSCAEVGSGVTSVSNNMNCVNNTIDRNLHGIRVQKDLDGEPPEVLIQNNNITRNGSDGYGYGIYLSDNGDYAVDPELITITCNNVWGNENDYGGYASPGAGDISLDPIYRDRLSLSSVPESEFRPANKERAADEDILLILQEKEERRSWERGVRKDKKEARMSGRKIRLSDFDYRLNPGSPSIDRGTNQDAPSDDRDGIIRPDPHTGKNDIGCYEFVFAPLDSGDYDGDGSSDIAVFRAAAGLWAIRGISRVYFGNVYDRPIPGDYDDDGTTDIGIFRLNSGLWSIKDITRTYFGSASDLPVPGDYDGDGFCDIGIFRQSFGLWAIRGITRFYFGDRYDRAIPGDYDGDGTEDIALFRGSSKLWAVRNISRFYFGQASDGTVAGDYDGDGTREAAIFRYASGLWSIRGITGIYFGSASDQAVPADYDGNAADDIGIFRSSSGLWAVRGMTRIYYGSSGDIPVSR